MNVFPIHRVALRSPLVAFNGESSSPRIEIAWSSHQRTENQGRRSLVKLARAPRKKRKRKSFFLFFNELKKKTSTEKREQENELLVLFLSGSAASPPLPIGSLWGWKAVDQARSQERGTRTRREREQASTRARKREREEERWRNDARRLSLARVPFPSVVEADVRPKTTRVLSNRTLSLSPVHSPSIVLANSEASAQLENFSPA